MWVACFSGSRIQGLDGDVSAGLRPELGLGYTVCMNQGQGGAPVGLGPG